MYPLATLHTMKDAGFRIRVERELRQSFIEACMVEDRPAAQVLRDFMREYIRETNEKAAREGASTMKNDE